MSGKREREKKKHRGKKTGGTTDNGVCVPAIDPIETTDKKKKRTEKKSGV
jgi:hypothetical protein